MNATIGHRIKDLRKVKKLSQVDFSSMLGIDNSQLSKIEQGKLMPTLHQVIEISSKFDISLDVLVKGEAAVSEGVHESGIVYDTRTIPPVVDIVPSGSANVIVLQAKSAASDFTLALTDPVYYGKGSNYETISLPQLQYRKGPFFATEIEGDSMHSTLTHGELLVGHPIPAVEFIGGYIHTLYHNIHGLITKRMHWIDKECGHLLLTCDNEDIDDQEAHISELSPYILRAICSVNFNLRNWNNDVRRELRDIRKDVRYIKQTLNL